MKKLTANDPETCSTDFVAENLEHLKALFPEAFTEGKIDFEVLKQLLGGEIDEREEKYGLNWHGKRQARQLALTPSTGTLRPCPEESVDWDTTHNLMIEGDNLEVLKLLQKSYAGKVKLIYIDPPYKHGSRLRLSRQLPGQHSQLPRSHGAAGRRWKQGHLEQRDLGTVPYRLAEHDVSASEARAKHAKRRWSPLRQH